MNDASTLIKKMSKALRGKKYIQNIADRIRLYHAAKIYLNGISDKEWREADKAALENEMKWREAV